MNSNVEISQLADPANITGNLAKINIKKGDNSNQISQDQKYIENLIVENLKKLNQNIS